MPFFHHRTWLQLWKKLGVNENPRQPGFCASVNGRTRWRRLVVAVLVRSSWWWFFQLIAPETRRPREEERHCQHEPKQHEHPGTPSVAASSLRWSWKAISETFGIRASRLRVPQQVKKPVHSGFMAENAFTRIVTAAATVSVSHLDASKRCFNEKSSPGWMECVKLSSRAVPRQIYFPSKLGNEEVGPKKEGRESCCFIWN